MGQDDAKRKSALLPVVAAFTGLTVAGIIGAFGFSRLDAGAGESTTFWPWRAGPHIAIADAALAANAGTIATIEARTSLKYAPLSARAFSILGRGAIARGDLAEADALMAATSRRSLRDAPSQVWIFARALEKGRFDAALTAYDVLMRRRPDLSEQLSPAVFAAIDESVEARETLARRLALHPSWRSPFLAAYSRASDKPATVHALLSELRARGDAPTDAEFKPYIDRLLRDGAYVAAYVAWAEHNHRLGAEDAITDGGFEADDLPPPFGWTFTTVDGASAQKSSPGRGEGVVLQAVVSGGLRRRVIAEQLLVLPSDSYRLSGRARVESGDLDGQLIWVVRCEGGTQRMLGSVEPTTTGDSWSSFEATISVPLGCPAQRLQLEARPGTSSAPLSVAFDNLRMAPSHGSPNRSIRSGRPTPSRGDDDV